MTDKDLAHRYADVTSLVADLEDALALEAARQGTSTGEATAVIRTLPARARRRLPFRMRHSLPVLGILGADRRRRGRSSCSSSRRGPAPRRARHRLRPDRAVDADRHQGRLRPARARPTTTTRSATTRSTTRRSSRVVDRDDGTSWSTESYQDGLEGAGKSGVGIYIDAKPKVAAVQMQIDTPQAGLQGRRSTPPRPAPCRSPCPKAGRRSAAARSSSSDKRFKLDTGGTEYRYYLVWITKLAAGRDQRRDLRDPPLPGGRGLEGTTARSVSKRSSARASRRSQSAGNVRPVASQSFG